ncbi:8-oxoguanine DNA glycosylase N-terminal [Penicillium cinerascens]|uniref:DNA-(apurinic or apyrimidinic site) lyase n=1 Tax=Penicillium cinerascens TaxID=70096 RepID=A0A9W9M7B9_9EURO|nr:8-oxoguanine DNA glycosylase N-terminal [Penicillium cinerascens]KAJ5191409.1 8-oxoguanine DNA glycosylase N-terminal [Penicillium cinerascens]
MAGVFSEWRKLPVSLSELCINTTLRCGQSFRWHNIPESQEWRCVLYGHLLSLKQDSSSLYYRAYQSQPPPLPTPPSSEIPSRAQSNTEVGDSKTHLLDSQDDHLVHILKHYLNLSSNLTDLYAQWSSSDPNFKKKAAQFSGIRILRQDPWEALVSFICSSNNNISRISQMVEKLCINYGPFVGKVDGRAYHDFPTPEALAGKDVESNLRSLGFGYRARYIYQTAIMVSQERENGWLNGLCNPESPAFGVEAKAGSEMKPEGREGYREAHEKLLELQGVGPKVADCVSLFGLGWGESVPVDTHVWQIAQRDYRFGKGSHKSLTKATYDAIGNHFRKLWGQEAGWAHSVLFTADLRSFADRLAATKKVDVAVKEEDSEVKIETEVTTAVVLTAPKEEVDVKLEEEPEAKAAQKASRGKKRKGSTEDIIHASSTTETRRMSKRLRQ